MVTFGVKIEPDYRLKTFKQNDQFYRRILKRKKKLGVFGGGRVVRFRINYRLNTSKKHLRLLPRFENFRGESHLIMVQTSRNTASYYSPVLS